MKEREVIAGEIDNEGLWYWIQNRYYRRYANVFSMETLKKIIEAGDILDEVEKLLEEEGYLLS